MVLDHLEPKKVFRFFEELSAIPHGSGNTDEIGDYCVRFAMDRNFEFYRDGLGNVIIVKEASPGYEGAETVILQGHLDMVCEKEPGCGIDFKRDGLELQVDGDFVSARGTTLGGDDGIAVAMALAILDSDGLPHPRIEAVFTVGEEIGLVGALGIEIEHITGRRMINIDSEKEGVFTVGSAAGLMADCVLQIKRERKELLTVEIELCGLLGGHSGADIDKRRGNSNVLMGRLLKELCEKADIHLVTLDGGLTPNAIPCRTAASIGVSPDARADVAAVCASVEAAFKEELRDCDSSVAVAVKFGEIQAYNALLPECSALVAEVLTELPDGVRSMSETFPGLVQTSLNLGILKLEGENLCAKCSLRSASEAELDALVLELQDIMSRLGGVVGTYDSYPGWEYKAASPLLETMAGVFEKQYGKSPRVTAIHAGLECGVFSRKIPGLDCVSIGPDIFDIHTPSERMSISSVRRVWAFLLEVLKECK